MADKTNSQSPVRPKRPTRHMLNAPGAVIDINAARSRRVVSSVEDETLENGVRRIHIIVPTTDHPDGVQRLDISYLAGVPQLAKPLTEALLAILSRTSIRSLRTRDTYIYHLRVGFIAYIKERHDPTQFDLAHLTTATANDFVMWLKKRKWKKRTCSKTLGVLAIIASVLRKLSWGSVLPSNLHIPQGVFPGAERAHTPTAVLNAPELAALYHACAKEITSTILSVEKDWKLIEAARAKLATIPDKRSAYMDIGVCLAALDSLFPIGRIPTYTVLRKHNSALAYAISVKHQRRALRCHHPHARDLVPFALLFAIQFLYNPDLVITLKHGDFSIENILGVPHLRGRPFKPRSGQRQPRTIPVSLDDPTNPAAMLTFLKRWTARLCPVAPIHLQDRVFLYAPYRGDSSPVSSWSATNDQPWRYNLDAFLREHNLPIWIGLRNLRATGLDLVHEMSGGDLRAVIAMGGQRNPQTIHSHYTSDAARQRNDERLGGVMKLRERWRETNGRIDPGKEPQSTDQGCATPGWRCADPFNSPQPSQTNGKLCSAFGACPQCALAQIDFNSAYTCARAYQLREEIRTAQGYLPARRWLDAWAPRLERLQNFWLPHFREEVATKAKNIHLSRLPRLE